MPSALDVDIEGDAGDWRQVLVARVAQDSPPYKVGDLVRQVSAVEVSAGKLISFATPSSVAMALNVARQAATTAEDLRTKIVFRAVNAGDKPAFGVASDSLPVLYDFLENSMLSAVFSYQAIEAFANSSIVRGLTSPQEVTSKGKSVVMTPEEMERWLTTSEKLDQVLPLLKSVKSPKGTVIWQNFQKLEDARNSTVHIKTRDQYGNTGDSLFFQMLSVRTTAFPSIAAKLIRHYFLENQVPRWLLKFLRLTDGI